MATKTATKAGLALRAGIARVQPALAAWRQRRKHREPIPEALWQAMASLAREYGLNPVARSLGINYTALKRHLVGGAVGPAAVGGTGPAAFLEVPMPAGSLSWGWVIELEDRCGRKLTLRAAQSDGAAVLALAQGLWEQRA
jgi:hypothetical protein